MTTHVVSATRRADGIAATLVEDAPPSASARPSPNLEFVRRVILLAALLAAVVACSDEATEEPGIDVIDVSGPLDASALEFMDRSIHAAAERGQVLAVLQIDSPAVLDGEALSRLEQTLASPPLPVAAWVGPAPARARAPPARE